MGVIVFDSDVLIGFMNQDDAQHEASIEVMRASLRPGSRRVLCAVNLSEILIGPIRRQAVDRVDAMLVRYNVETITVDMALARRAAAVRVRTDLELPDAYALATAIHAEHRGHDDVRMASLDAQVLRAHAELHPDPDRPGHSGTL